MVFWSPPKRIFALKTEFDSELANGHAELTELLDPSQELDSFDQKRNGGVKFGRQRYAIEAYDSILMAAT